MYWRAYWQALGRDWLMLELFVMDAEGVPQPCTDLGAWATATNGAQTIARTAVGPGYVSTIFLGYRSATRRERPPMLFETMTFGIDAREGADERYATRTAALDGHARHVAAAQAAIAAESAYHAAPPTEAA